MVRDLSYIQDKEKEKFKTFKYTKIKNNLHQKYYSKLEVFRWIIKMPQFPFLPRTYRF